MQAGIQISSFQPLLRTEMQVRDAFRKLSEMGCRIVQTQWIDFAVPIEAIAEALRENGLCSVSTQDFYEVVEARKDYFVRLNRATGGKWLCVSRIPQRFRSRDGLCAFAGELRQFAKELEEEGLKLCFHPTSPDYTYVDGVEPVAYLMETLPELSLCLDLYHVNRSGRSMTAMIEQYAGRICMVHFKESRKEPNGSEILVPVGQGDTDWSGVVPACQKAKVPYGFVEQESWERDPFVCLSEALGWLEHCLQ